jgi:uncharacterized protein (TIGR02271 family)
MATTVVGLFDERDHAAEAVRDLRAKGFGRDQIGMVAADPEGKLRQYETDESGNRAGEGASVGMVSGLLIGGVVGFLAGAGLILLPGGFLALGPLAGAIGGAVTGGIAGGIVGGLIGLGIPREHAEVYAEGIRRGGTLVTVRCNTEDGVKTATKVMDRDGAVDIEERGAAYRAEGFTTYDPKAPVYSDEQARMERERRAALIEEKRVPVVEEQVRIEKQQVPVGGVRVRQYVSETPVHEQTVVREEHVDVQRRPADRPADPAMLDAFTEGVIEIPEMTEVPVIAKEPRVVEEVVISKEATQQPATVEDSVRRTNVEVERIGSGQVDFHDHFQDHYSRQNLRYEQVAPAYQYGSQLAVDRNLEGRDWNGVEGEVRRHWETRNPRTWDLYRDAIRTGYERSRSNTRGARLL